mgnify:CR=1 FL=1
MLLVKWKELKNSNSKTPIFSIKTGVSLLFLCLSSSLAWAQESKTTAQTLSSPSSILSIFLSLMLVIAIILALAYLMRRFNVTQAGNGQMKVVASMVAGTKEKIMVLEVGDEQHLIGVTAHNINHLAKLENKLDSKNAMPGDMFKDKLGQAMGIGRTSNKEGKANV